MKILLLIRHAKSSWDFNEDDFNRSLNSRGEADAPVMAKRLQKKDIEIDMFVSSPARRAITTAHLFAETYETKKKKVVEIPSLYEPTMQAFKNAIEDLEDEYKTVAIFSHNPSITEFANTLTATKIDDMPTCGIFTIMADINHWKDFSTSKKEFLFFDYPKH